MAQYLLLIYGDETAFENPNPEAWNQMMEQHGTFAQGVVKQGGKIVAGEALQPTATATSVRGWDSGDPVVTDGPFVETKEALGGFYIVEAADLDQAITFAKQCPAPAVGTWRPGESRRMADDRRSAPRPRPAAARPHAARQAAAAGRDGARGCLQPRRGRRGGERDP